MEPLETRSLLSTVLLNGFPAAGFRAEALDGSPPWDVAAFVDNGPVTAQGFAESTEKLADAAVIALSESGGSWVAGIIGDTLLRGSDAATNDVDIYRIDLPDGDHYALNLQALARRFGSALDPAVSVLAANGQVIATNDDALHAGFLSEAELFTGLDGGSYYIAVSAGGNLPGEGGLDPLVPGSGHGSRGTTGQYLLRVHAVPDSTQPTVVATSIEAGATLDSVPTEITVQFSEAMDLAGLRDGATLTAGDGTAIGLEAIKYDSDSREITYRLLDRPIAGDYQFALHAAQVQDHASNPIDGGTSGGDFNLEFRIDAPALNLADTESNDTAATAQPLGPLFTTELTTETGLQIAGTVTATSAPGDRDFFSFQVTRTGLFTIRLTPGPGTSQTGLLRLHDAAGKPIAQAGRLPGFGSSMIRFLKPGDYLLEMDASGGPATGTYQLTIRAALTGELPLTENNLGPSVQVVLRTRDGERPPESEPARSTESSTRAISPMSYSVSALPAVASQPAGQPQRPAASPTELAWVDQSSGGPGLPAGFTLRAASTAPAARFSVAGVSGTYHDSLPDTIPYGTHALDPSAQLVSELAALFRGEFGDGAAGSGPAATIAGDSGLAAGVEAGAAALDSAEGIDEATELASSPPTLALGMVASIGAASVMTAPNRRRATIWLQRVVEFLGLN